MTTLLCQPVRYEGNRAEIHKMLGIAESMAASNPDSSLMYAQQSLSLSIEEDYAIGVYLSRANLTKLYRYKGMYAEGIEQVDKLKSEQNQVPDTILAKAIMEEGIIYMLQRKTDQADEAFDVVVRLAKKSSDNLSLVRALINKASIKLNRQDYLVALRDYLEALGTCRDHGYKEQEAAVLNNIAIIYKKEERHGEALKYYQEALAVFEQLEKKFNQGITLQNIGVTYRNLKDYAAAEESYGKAIEIFSELGNERRLVPLYNNLAELNYHSLKNYGKAEQYYLKALPGALKYHISEDLMYIYYGLAKVNFQLEEYGDCEAYLRQAGIIADTLNNEGEKKKILNLQIASSLAESNQAGLLEKFRQFNDMTDSVYNKSTQRQVNEFIEKYKSKEKEELIETQKTVIEKNSDLIGRQKTIQLLLSALLGISVCMIVIIYAFSLKIRQKNNELLGLNLNIQRQNEALQKSESKLKAAKKDLELQHRAITESNRNLEQFAHMAAHDIKGPLRTISTFAALLSDKYKDKLDADALNFQKFIIESSNDLTNIVDGLLEFSKVSTSSNLVFNEVDLNAVIGQCEKLLGDKIRKYGVAVSVQPDFPAVCGVKELLSQLFINLFNNSIKFSQKLVPPEISVTWEMGKDNSMLVCTVKDNGIGIPEGFRENIFTLFSKYHQSNEIEGAGMGLSICKKIVEKHGGEIWVESEESVGTSFSFTLKLANAQPYHGAERSNPQALQT